jgi:Uma2 family endonuclease
MPERHLPAIHNQPMTGEELLALGDIGPCELVEGRIVMMTPAGAEHGGCEFRFASSIEKFDQGRTGRVLVGEVGIYTRRNPDTVRGADVAFISHERYARRKRKHGYLDVAPELVVEIRSPDDRPGEIETKVREYLACGVLLVWVADPRKRTVNVYRSGSDSVTLGAGDILIGGDVVTGLEVPVASLFEE